MFRELIIALCVFLAMDHFPAFEESLWKSLTKESDARLDWSSTLAQYFFRSC